MSGQLPEEHFNGEECQLRLEDRRQKVLESRQVAGSFNEPFMFSACSIPIAVVVECDNVIVLRKQFDQERFGDPLNLGTIVR